MIAFGLAPPPLPGRQSWRGRCNRLPDVLRLRPGLLDQVRQVFLLGPEAARSPPIFTSFDPTSSDCLTRSRVPAGSVLCISRSRRGCSLVPFGSNFARSSGRIALPYIGSTLSARNSATSRCGSSIPLRPPA